MIRYKGRLYDAEWLGKWFGLMFTISYIWDLGVKYYNFMVKLELKDKRRHRLARLYRRIRARLQLK